MCCVFNLSIVPIAIVCGKCWGFDIPRQTWQCNKNNRLGGATIVISAGCPNSVPTVLGFTACFCPSMHQLDNEQNKDF